MQLANDPVEGHEKTCKIIIEMHNNLVDGFDKAHPEGNKIMMDIITSNIKNK